MLLGERADLGIAERLERDLEGVAAQAKETLIELRVEARVLATRGGELRKRGSASSGSTLNMSGSTSGEAGGSAPAPVVDDGEAMKRRTRPSRGPEVSSGG